MYIYINAKTITASRLENIIIIIFLSVVYHIYIDETFFQKRIALQCSGATTLSVFFFLNALSQSRSCDLWPGEMHFYRVTFRVAEREKKMPEQKSDDVGVKGYRATQRCCMDPYARINPHLETGGVRTTTRRKTLRNVQVRRSEKTRGKNRKMEDVGYISRSSEPNERGASLADTTRAMDHTSKE